MKTGPSLLYLALLFLLTNCNPGPGPATTEETPPPSVLSDSTALEEGPQPYFLKKYEGALNGKIPIEMVLINWGDGYLSGRYWYKDKGKPIELVGELSSGADFQIVEYVKNKETGSFAGILSEPSLLTGAWSSPDRSRNFTFELRETPPSPEVGAWAGNWHLNEVWDKGTLMIGNVDQDSFDFALTIVRSSHTGTIEGRAAVHGNKAAFSHKEFEEQPCVLLFSLEGEHIQLDQPSSNFACGFGVRAFAGGKYERRNLIKKATLEAGNGEQAVFPTPALHDAFKALVGEAVYELFAFNMQEKEFEKKAQGLTIVTGAVPGLFRTNEAVIMFDKNGTIWAATLDVDGTTNESLVRYFTNDPGSKQKMPADIQSWREGFKDYRVIY